MSLETSSVKVSLAVMEGADRSIVCLMPAFVRSEVFWGKVRTEGNISGVSL